MQTTTVCFFLFEFVCVFVCEGRGEKYIKVYFGSTSKIVLYMGKEIEERRGREEKGPVLWMNVMDGKGNSKQAKRGRTE